MILLEKTKDQVVNLCYRFLLNREDALDLSQEVYIEVFQSIAQFKAKAKLRTWIYQIATRKCLDELRRRKRKKRITIFEKTRQADQTLEIKSSVDLETSLEKKEQLAILIKMLDKLPENQKVAFILSNFEVLDNEEVAIIMNLSKQAVESLLYRARKKLKSWLADFYARDDHSSTSHCKNTES